MKIGYEMWTSFLWTWFEQTPNIVPSRLVKYDWRSHMFTVDVGSIGGLVTDRDTEQLTKAAEGWENPHPEHGLVVKLNDTDHVIRAPTINLIKRPTMFKA